MSWPEWLQVGALVGLVLVVDAAPRRLPRARVRRGERARRPGLPLRSSACSTALRRRPQARAGVARLRALAPRVQRRLGASASTSSSGSRAGCRSTRPTSSRVPPALAFNTAVSFVTNTNWQNYGGESTMSHLTQMAGLTVQNFVSAAVGIAVAVALIRGLVRAQADDDRELLGRPHADDRRASCCRWRSSFALVFVEPGRRAEPARPGRGDARVERRRRRRSPRARRQPGGDQGARDERRRARQRQLGAPVREPERASRTCSRCGRCSLIPFALTFTFGRIVEGPAPGLGDLRGDVRALDRRGGELATAFESHGNPRSIARGTRREHGGQGGPLRRRRIGPLRRVDDRHLDRRGRSPRTTASRRSAAPCRSST